MSGTTQNLDETNERLPPTRGTALYLIAIEDIVRSPLIQSQVFSLVIEMASRSPLQDFAIVALYPIANWVKYRSRVSELRQQLEQHRVQLHVLPILFLTRDFYFAWWLAPLFAIQIWAAAVWIGLRCRPSVLHCRSYPAALVGWVTRLLWGTPFIFDTRAPFPEEGAVREIGGRTNRMDVTSYRFWKWIERRLIMAAGFTTVVSQANADHLAAAYPAQASELQVLPTSAPVIDEAVLATWREQTRAKLGADSAFVLVYAGSWSEPELLRSAYKLVQDALPDTSWWLLLLVTYRAIPSGVKDIDKYFQTVLETPRCTVHTASPDEVGHWLAGADLAILPLSPSPSFEDDPKYVLWSQTVLSVKFVEYLAAGLPVLVSSWAGAAADLVTTHDLGLVYDTATPTELDNWLGHWKMERKEYRQRTWEYAREHFALDVIARRYLDLYDACESGCRRP